MAGHRLHVLGLPHSPTHRDFTGDAFAMKVHKFLKMMSGQGLEIFHYGHQRRDWDYPDVEHVTVIDDHVHRQAYGDDYVDHQSWREHGFARYYAINDLAHQTFHARAISEIARRRQPLDFILHFWGQGTQAVALAHSDLINVEPGLGNGSGFARWRVYESYTLRSACEGINAVNYCSQDWYHTVIPNYFDPEDFDYSRDKDNYVLYLGRIGTNKGVDIAITATEHAGIPLKIAGQGSLADLGYTQVPDHVEVIGYADQSQRRRLLSRAQAVFIASRYAEPFGGIQVEAWLSGTPVISPDWAAFGEFNQHGRTGYRCRTLKDFVLALDLCRRGSIDPDQCRQHAQQFTLDQVRPQYLKYFNDLMSVYTGPGWTEL